MKLVKQVGKAIPAFAVTVLEAQNDLAGVDTQSSWKFEVDTFFPTTRTISYFQVHNYPVSVDTITNEFTVYQFEIVDVDEAFGEVLITWFTLDSNFAKNKVVALDPEYGMTVKYDALSTAHAAIFSKRYEVDREVEVVITDLQEGAAGSTITFTGELASISEPRVIDDVIEIDITLKIANGDPVIAAIV